MISQDPARRAGTTQAAASVALRRYPGVAARYGVAVGATVVAFALTGLLHPHLAQSSLVLFFAAVAVSAWYGGLGPGLATAVLSVAAADYAFLDPVGAFSPVSPANVLALGAFGAVSAMIGSLTGSLHAARRRSDAAAAEALAAAARSEEQAAELEHQVQTARRLAAQVEQANEELGAALETARRARHAAEAAEGRATGVLESITDAFIACDGEWRFRYVNRHAETLLCAFGCDPRPTLGGELWEACPALRGTQFAAAARRTAAERVTTESEEYYPTIGRWLRARIYPGDGGVAVYLQDVTARNAAEATREFQLEATRRLATSLGLEATLRTLTALVVSHLADYCLVYLADDAGHLRQAAAAHVDPAKAPLLDELARCYHPGPSNPHSISAQVVTSTRPVLRPVPTLADAGTAAADPELRRIYRELDPRSYIVVPLVAGRQTVGTMTLATTAASGRDYTEDDLALVEIFAARAALAISNARLYDEAEAARERAVEHARLESQLAQARLDALRAQMNPHFLFNALNTVAMLVRRGARDDALEGIVGVSELLRGLLAQRGAAVVTLGDEVAVLERYLAVERLRYGERVSVRFAVEPAVLGARVPAMLLQPLVENAVRHGVAQRGGPGRITVTARRPLDAGAGRGGAVPMLTLEVQDDGPGLPPGFDVAATTGIGLANTRERLRRLYGDHHRFAMGNAPDGGTVVTIELPLT